MRFLSFLVYVPLQIAFIPLAVVGLILATYRQVFVSRRLGVSATGIEVIGGRWSMHVFGLRSDEASARLTRALPNVSTLGLWLVLFPLWVKAKVAGSPFLYPRVPPSGDEVLTDMIVARTLHFDELIERGLSEVRQFVVLGAGFDTRVFGTHHRRGIRYFEVDQLETQRLKQAALAEAGIDSSGVTFVTVDFRREDLCNRLEESGYDRAAPTLFLWEGVTLYLGEGDVRGTLRSLRSRSAPGSRIVADFYGQRLIDYASKGINRKTLELTDETLAFGLPFVAAHEEVLRDFVRPEGWSVSDARFLGTNHRKGPYLGVAELRQAPAQPV